MTQDLYIGMGATMHHYSDLSAGTVIEIRIVRGKIEVVIQEDRAIRTDNNGMSELQSYEYQPDPGGRVFVCRYRKESKKARAGWYEKSEFGWGWRVTFGSRRAYHDYSF